MKCRKTIDKETDRLLSRILHGDDAHLTPEQKLPRLGFTVKLEAREKGRNEAKRVLIFAVPATFAAEVVISLAGSIGEQTVEALSSSTSVSLSAVT
ncbi:UNVERIFIED_CONTAM: hypothetical protein Sangu_1609600 [Sesamum angustifolium]|uniref:Uncharacterized protein n=1 Tax=Sesamum angustifolium TaxID=2727405 RepID=A0AAW2MKJ1_9LAMI